MDLDLEAADLCKDHRDLGKVYFEPLVRLVAEDKVLDAE